LDVESNDIIKQFLNSTGLVDLLISEEEPLPIACRKMDTGNAYSSSGLMVSFDPLDGSSNIDCAVPTGTIFGVYRLPNLFPPNSGKTGVVDYEKCFPLALQPGINMLAAGYIMYSSSTELVLTTGSGTHGFTLDPVSKCFILTRRSIQCPARGPYYSLNEGRSGDWPAGLKRYIDDIKNGKSKWGKRYSSRYVCSLVADLHRTLLYGGWAGNPRSHLRLLFEAAPLAFITEQAGGAASDGKRRIMEIVPSTIHQRLPVFLGSSEDIEELENYGDVQQLGSKTYEA